MAYLNTILSQLLVHMPRHDFQSLVSQWKADRYVKRFTTWNQLVTFLYAQAGDKKSLRDIQNGLTAHAPQLYHLGFEGTVARSTLSDANASRDWHIFQGIFQALLGRCRSLSPKHKFKFKNPLKTLDSTVIELCLTMYPWAKFRRAKGALKLHCLLDHAGDIPSFVVVTDGKCSDIRAVKTHFSPVPDSIYCFDRGYTDYGFFHRIHKAEAFFVTRARINMNARVIGQQERSKNKAVLADQMIETTGRYSAESYPSPLRLICFYDAENDRTFEFLTNHFGLPASTIADIYKARWQIEAFFKFIKQNLKIKTFLGVSKNAVLSQVWVALCYYLLLAYIKSQTKYRFSLFYLHRLIRETLLERLSLIDLLGLKEARLPKVRDKMQLCFGF
jgi:hypothetical protein